MVPSTDPRQRLYRLGADSHRLIMYRKAVFRKAEIECSYKDAGPGSMGWVRVAHGSNNADAGRRCGD